METNLIVPEFDVPRNILFRLLPCRVNCPVDALYFKRRIERFGQAVVKAYTSPAHGLTDIQPFQDGSELGGSIVTAAVAVKPISA